MPYYRLYHFSPASGHIDRVEDFEAADDIEAIAVFRHSERHSAAELWQEGRKVLRLENPSQSPVSSGGGTQRREDGLTS